MDNFLKTEKIYSLLELNNIVRSLIRREFPENIWVCGEIQDLKDRKDKKHIYFNLVQKHPEGDEVIAQAKAIIFEDTKLLINKKIENNNINFKLKDDIEVKLLCRVDFYPKWGEYRLVVLDIDPIYTLGKIAQNRQRIIEELKKEGLLDKNKQLKFPLLPLKIGLITSFGSAAYYDFINELNLSKFGFKILLYDSYMQGIYVEKDIISALQFFNKLSLDELDVIVITRGGGSTADLSWFDNKNIAKAIALSKFPVLSAIGHEINTTITDIVAHTFVKTPTKGAQFLIEQVKNFLEKVKEAQEKILKYQEEFLLNKKKELETLTIKFDSVVPRYFSLHKEELLTKKFNILGVIKNIIFKNRQYLENIFSMLNFKLNKYFKKFKDEVKYREDKVRLLDPKNVLKRGYSITLKDNKVLKSAKDIEEESFIETILYEGKIFSQVKRKFMRERFFRK
ncbi:MAG: exodeoxyribonuclease VII large subunit [Candidatus Aenigmatarchaeota archaeon]